MWIDQWLMIKGEMTCLALIVYIIHIYLRGKCGQTCKIVTDFKAVMKLYTSVVNVRKLAKLPFVKAKSCLSLLY